MDITFEFFVKVYRVTASSGNCSTEKQKLQEEQVNQEHSARKYKFSRA